MDSNECNTLIPAARSASGKPLEKVPAEIDAAGMDFGEATHKRFGRKGEW